MNPVTEHELRQAFNRCRLWCSGWSYAQAIAVDCIRTSLTCAAIARRRRIEQQQGKPAPMQPTLI